MKLSETQRRAMSKLALPGRELRTGVGLPPGRLIEFVPWGGHIRRDTFRALLRRNWIQWHRRSSQNDYYVLTPAGRRAQEDGMRWNTN